MVIALEKVSNFMDVATKYDTIESYIKELQNATRLLTEKEFEPLSQKKWVQKFAFHRLLGCDHLANKIAELHLVHINVPLKVLVIPDAETLQVTAWDYNMKGHMFEVHVTNSHVWAKRIESADRKLTRGEIDELIQIIASVNFSDLHPENVVVAEDGVYFIDTEYKSFSHTIYFEKLGRFESLGSSTDQAYFFGKVEEKMAEPSAPAKDYKGYQSMTNLLSLLANHQKECKDLIQKIKKDLSDLEYVGASKVGSAHYAPHNFSFDLSKILDHKS